jgi:RimJ/RimL family protein N-acetyltransferase
VPQIVVPDNAGEVAEGPAVGDTPSSDAPGPRRLPASTNSTGFNGLVPNVTLEPIDASNWREALGVRVTDEQLPFVADHQPVALVILAKSYVQQGGHRWEPLLVRSGDGVAVGVLALEHKLDDACEIRNFAVDIDSQGCGIGTAGALAVIAWASRSDSDCLQLAVSAHPDNHAAHRTYEAAGFRWNGELRGREPVMRLPIEPSADERPSRSPGPRHSAP